MAMMATAARSMPRPMITIAMATARMPSTETLRTIETMFSGVRNPLSSTAHAANRAADRARTMRSWVMPDYRGRATSIWYTVLGLMAIRGVGRQ